MTDHYEMPHARADECPHAGVGKACRPCRDRFERAPITPDERAAMRERYAADLPSAWETSAAAHARALRDLGAHARVDVPRLLDALDTAEARQNAALGRVKTAKDEVRRVDNFLRLERGAARENLARAEKAEAEVARLRAAHDLIASVAASGLDVRESVATLEALAARPAPVWDEDTVTEAVAREHAPVRPDRESVWQAWHGTDEPWGGCADAEGVGRVLDLWPGESRATVQAETLRDAAETYERESGTSNGTIPWLRARADRLEQGEADRG